MTGSKTPRNPWAGGAPLALFTLAGPFVAAFTGYSTSAGFLAGLGVGIVVALLIWLMGSR
jgi:hypothetical protein